ncbi:MULTISPECIES: hypothetical protein [unclassified Microbacterium]|uniref:hypothetical protein n=1 Tax=unclassified Microbacterium TaxID=2609290 RepID=UPI00214BE857|nr:MULTISPECIES: hypothetical protein [unclassified Microbacterium]MCR2800788.1 hypothetical protein [Microbacterium sp. zg.Y818]WIM23507.1 hypothetical protein QNO21_05605 [Microbacterium sp. zg-Y818]
MNRDHRRRLLFIVVLVFTGLGSTAVGIGNSQGALVGLTVFVVAAVFPAALFAVLAYVWSANDREVAARGLPPLDPDHLP